jgi:hypothetical protein
MPTEVIPKHPPRSVARRGPAPGQFSSRRKSTEDSKVVTWLVSLRSSRLLWAAAMKVTVRKRPDWTKEKTTPILECRSLKKSNVISPVNVMPAELAFHCHFFACEKAVGSKPQFSRLGGLKDKNC